VQGTNDDGGTTPAAGTQMQGTTDDGGISPTAGTQVQGKLSHSDLLDVQQALQQTDLS